MSSLGPDDRRRIDEASASLQRGDVAGAAAAMRGLSPAANGHPDASLVAARILLAQGRDAVARQVLEAAIALTPNRPDLWDTLGDAFAGRPEDAERAYAEAAARSPNPFEYWLQRAMSALDRARLDAAEAAVDRLSGLAPADPRRWVAQGLLEQARGRAAEAIECYRRALKLAPADGVARHNLAAALRVSDVSPLLERRR
ncbi:MAG: tetratricopeptide repeat protein [Parvularculaceae bacterium]|nr:tetratricopeptide repeat protein [Parvularculaceae bacterium]